MSTITVWLWDASGPGVSMSGVSATNEAAQQAAEGCIEQGAVWAGTELAFLVLGPEMTYYNHAGTGWTAEFSPESRSIEWEPFCRYSAETEAESAR